MSEDQPISHDKHITHDDLERRFDTWKSELDDSAKQEASDLLWSKFLLQMPDDGSDTFAFAMDESIRENNDRIVELVRGRQSEEALVLLTLTNQMNKRYGSMFSWEQVPGRVESIAKRVSSPIRFQLKNMAWCEYPSELALRDQAYRSV